jgi:hypothetical protein
VNASGKENITDAILTLSFLFTGEPATLECEKSADVDDSGKLDLTDPINLLGYLFKGEPPPSAPFSICGMDRTIDGLGCKLYPPCAQAP